MRAVTQIKPTTTNHCSTPLPSQIIATGSTTPSCYVTADQGYPSGLVTSFNPATDNITWVPKNTRDSYVENYFFERSSNWRRIRCWTLRMWATMG